MFAKPVFTIVAAALWIATAASHAAVISFDPAAQSVFLGDSVAVDVQISELGAGAAPSLGTFDMGVRFDAGILALTDVVFGSLLGNPDLFAFEAFVDVLPGGPGLLQVAELSLLPAADLGLLQGGGFTLFTLVFDTLTTGTAALATQVDYLGDAFGAPLPVIGNPPGFITVSERPARVPEPDSLLLIVAGLLACGLLRRLRNRHR